jgi:hypothetical protein
MTKKVMATIQVIGNDDEDVTISDVAGDKEDSKYTIVEE